MSTWDLGTEICPVCVRVCVCMYVRSGPAWALCYCYDQNEDEDRATETLINSDKHESFYFVQLLIVKNPNVSSPSLQDRFVHIHVSTMLCSKLTFFVASRAYL